MVIPAAGGRAELALLLCAAALLLVPGRRRLRREQDRTPVAVSGSAARRRGIVAGGAVFAGGVLLFPGSWWLVAPAAAALGFAVARRPTGRSATRRAADRRLVAVHAELLASCLDAGMAVAPALRAVGDVLVPGSIRGRSAGASGRGAGPGPAGPGRDRDPAGPLAALDAVAAMLSLGADPGTAWRLADLDEDLAPLAAAARRSAAGGGRLADAVREHAAQLRQENTAASVRAAGRAGVLMTAPLGACFLPAFLCWGLAPVVVGLLRQLDIF